MFQLRQHSARLSCALIITVNIFNENSIFQILQIINCVQLWYEMT